MHQKRYPWLPNDIKQIDSRCERCYIVLSATGEDNNVDEMLYNSVHKFACVDTDYILVYGSIETLLSSKNFTTFPKISYVCTAARNAPDNNRSRATRELYTICLFR